MEIKYQTKKDQARMLAKQSIIDKDFREVAKLICPILEDSKRITEREIKKAQKIVTEKYGLHESFYNKYQEKQINIPMYSIRKNFEHDFAPTIEIVAMDRSLKDSEGNNTLYIPNDTYTIYLTKERTIREDEKERQSVEYPEPITEQEAMKLIEQNDDLNLQIEELKAQRQAIRYSYYLN